MVEQDEAFVLEKEQLLLVASGRWRDVALGDVVTLQRGFDLPETERRPGPHPVIASTGPVGTHHKAAVKGPGVVIGRSGSLGGGQFIKSDFWPLNTTLWVKDFHKNDRRFCYYLLKSLNLADFNAGSGVPTLNRNHIHPLPVKVPDVPEQKAIAQILGTLDDKIELNRQMNETLKAMARALFKSWFVDFDPVRAKMEGSDTGLPPGVVSLFPNHLGPSVLGEVPAGWEVIALGEVVDVVGGTTPSTKVPEYWAEGTHYWATPKDLASLNVPVLLDTERKITDAGLNKIGSGLLSRGTVLLSSRAPIGYLAIAEVPVAINQGFIGITASERVSNLFILHWCETFHEEIVNHANGSTFLEISKKDFQRILAVVPDEAVMAAFDRLIRPLYDRIVSNERESRAIANQRDTLLPALAKGAIGIVRG